MPAKLLAASSILLSLLTTGVSAQAPVNNLKSLREGFASPPSTAKLRCYWWWLNGNTTEDTITNDLTEMSRKGFGGVLLIDANGSNLDGNVGIPAGPRFGSPEWMRLYLHALKVASELHMEVIFNMTSGWNLGSPDTTPEQASKVLTWSRTAVDGKGFDGDLPMPQIRNGFYQQIAVLAYPLLHGADLPGEGQDSRKALGDLRLKTSAGETGFSMPPSDSLLGNEPSPPGEEDADLSAVVDLTSTADAAGHISWHPGAKGAWEILRIGYTDSGARISTSSDGWQGLAIDYLDRKAFDSYWSATVAPILVASKPYLGTTLTNLATDSWELGGENWTARFASEFRTRRGYDPVRYLPIVAGRILGDRATSNRFLNDLRRTVGDLVTDHYDHFAERARGYGLGIQSESGGPHGAPIDALETFRSAAVPQTEYWAQSKTHRSTDQDRFFTKEAASAADIYGKHLVAQEGMTTIGPQWSESLATDLKPSFDQALTEGMNRLVWHEFTSSPASFGLPGNEYFAGTHINPRVTWWNQAAPFFLYLNRSQFLLQQGHAVDDVLYFYGDQVPNFVRLKTDDPAHVLPGYDYDVTNEDALLRTLSVAQGKISTPAGNVYRLMVLPTGRRISFASLQRMAAYVRGGGIIVGDPPLGTTGNVDNSIKQQFGDLTQALWAGCQETSHSYGSGKVFCGHDTRAILGNMGLTPDFDSTIHGLDYVHRADGPIDIYFVRNPTATAVDATVSFRVTGRVPEKWNAVDGSSTRQLLYRAEGGRTTMPLHLDPFGSAFVIFAAPEALHVTQVLRDGTDVPSVEIVDSGSKGQVLKRASAGNYELKRSDGKTLTQTVLPPTLVDLPSNRWTISFQPDRGAPKGSLPLPAFRSWSDMPDEGIRYFSGTASYKTTVDLKPATGTRVYLRLSDVHEICSVRVNGKDAGTIWSMPYRLDITDALQNGANTLELNVTNLWPNRLIGDAQPSATQTFTHTNIRKYTSASPLLPSGLVGPVSLETIRE